MSTIDIQQARMRTKVLFEGEPYVVMDNEFVKPGKGQAFNRVKLKNIKNGRLIQKTFKSGEMIELAPVHECEVRYLYAQDGFYVLMHVETFDMYSLSEDLIGDLKHWLKAECTYTLTLLDETPMGLEVPAHMALKVIDTDPGIKGDTASSGGGKPATLETGIVVRVPLFIQIGDWVKVDTRTQTYIERVKI